MEGTLVQSCAVAVDGSNASMEAVTWACRVTAPGGTVNMVDIEDFEPLFAEMGMVPYGVGPDVDMTNINKQWITTAQETCDKATEIVAASGRTSTWHVKEMTPGDGVPAAAFCKIAEDLEADMLIIGQHHGSRRIEGLFGSFPRWVITHATIPVLLVPIAQELEPGD